MVRRYAEDSLFIQRSLTEKLNEILIKLQGWCLRRQPISFRTQEKCPFDQLGA